MTILQKIKDSGIKTLVLFYGDQCAPCNQMKPLIREFAVQHGFNYEEINFKDELVTLRALGIKGVPAMVDVSGEGLAEISTGFRMQSQIRDLLAERGYIKG